jgi:hypothetical protein
VPWVVTGVPRCVGDCCLWKVIWVLVSLKQLKASLREIRQLSESAPSFVRPKSGEKGFGRHSGGGVLDLSFIGLDYQEVRLKQFVVLRSALGDPLFQVV